MARAPLALHVTLPVGPVPPQGEAPGTAMAAAPRAPLPPACPTAACGIVQPPWPALRGRMPDSTLALEQGIAGLFDADHGPDAALKIRRALPTILTHFFPWAPWGDDVHGLPRYLADCVLLYALQASKTALPEPHLHAFIDDFSAALAVSRKITRFMQMGEDADVVAEHGVRRYLREGRTVLCPGGADQGRDGHAVTLLMMPQPDGHVLCAVFNRGEGLAPWHKRDGDKSRPFLALLPAAALCGEAGAAPLCTLLELLTPRADNRMTGFYAALNTLVDACAGTRALGALPAADWWPVPGQSLQKGNECTISNTLAAMYFCMQVQLRCWQEPPSNTPAGALAVYRRIKNACRKVICDEVVAARGRAMAAGDMPQTSALTTALVAVATAMLPRLAHKPALRPLYASLPSDVRLCAEEGSAATSPSSA